MLKKYLYLDTEVFNKYRFDLDNPEFELLFHLTMDAYEIYVTSVTVHELEHQFRKRKNQIIKGYKKLLKDIRVPKKYFNQFYDFSKTFESDPYSGFKNDFNNTRINIIETYEQNISLKDIFNDYFNAKPPFKNGKNEFPDAFILNSILKHIKDNNLNSGNSIVISGNHKDFEEFCKINEITYFKDIISFCNWLKHDKYPEEYKQIKALVKGRIQSLGQEIIDTVASEEFLAGNDEQWEDLTIEDFDVDLGSSMISDEFTLLDFERVNGKQTIVIEVVCELDAKITFNGAHYDDADYWDKHFHFNYKTFEEDRFIEVVAIAELNFDEDSNILTVNKIAIPNCDSLELTPEPM